MQIIAYMGKLSKIEKTTKNVIISAQTVIISVQIVIISAHHAENAHFEKLQKFTIFL